jgi:hypothetical protein
MIIDEDALRKATNKWEEEAPIELLIDVAAYKQHFLEEHGINITLGKNIVVDEQKYMLFILRWS